MFSFKAYFFNHDVYINEKYKYAAGEILTAYLNTNFYEEIVSSGMISRMKRLRDDLILNDDMDYEMHSKYNTNVYRALSIFENIHAYLNKIPPYNKTIKPDYMTLDDLINKYMEEIDAILDVIAQLEDLIAKYEEAQAAAIAATYSRSPSINSYPAKSILY